MNTARSAGMSGLAAATSPTGNEMELSKMDDDSVSILDRLLQAAQVRREAAGRAYVEALLSSLAIGEPHYRVQQDHYGICQQGFALIEDASL